MSSENNTNLQLLRVDEIDARLRLCQSIARKGGMHMVENSATIISMLERWRAEFPENAELVKAATDAITSEIERALSYTEKEARMENMTHSIAEGARTFMEAFGSTAARGGFSV